MYKFRFMCLDAEEKLEELLDQNEIEGAMFKMKEDPRVTKIGKIIRAKSIDELPQLWNVLKGDMSLIGKFHIINTTKNPPLFYRLFRVFIKMQKVYFRIYRSKMQAQKRNDGSKDASSILF